MKVAVEGCVHGELDDIYETIRQAEQTTGEKVDLLLCCGDFQSVRNEDDLECLACPPKYRRMNTFYKYYSGEKEVPVPTVFIGGNHEASNYLQELYYGGWVCPNIYYLGFAGIIKFGGLRIGGLSGIFKQQHYMLGHYEQPPYSPDTLRSVYHVRILDTVRLMSTVEKMDIMLSHDWPRGIARYGDTQGLLRRKGFLEAEIANNSLGSSAGEEILMSCKPKHWFSAHLHTKFPAVVRHSDTEMTKFLALDKCLPGRHFLQILDFPDADASKGFQYDAEWCSVVKKTAKFHNCSRVTGQLPISIESLPTQDEKAAMQTLLDGSHGGAIPNNFVQTARPYDPEAPQAGVMQPLMTNPQTEAFCRLLGIPLPEYSISTGSTFPNSGTNPTTDAPPAEAVETQGNPEEIDLDL